MEEERKERGEERREKAEQEVGLKHHHHCWEREQKGGMDQGRPCEGVGKEAAEKWLGAGRGNGR